MQQGVDLREGNKGLKIFELLEVRAADGGSLNADINPKPHSPQYVRGEWGRSGDLT